MPGECCHVDIQFHIKTQQRFTVCPEIQTFCFTKFNYPLKGYKEHRLYLSSAMKIILYDSQKKDIPASYNSCRHRKKKNTWYSNTRTERIKIVLHFLQHDQKISAALAIWQLWTWELPGQTFILKTQLTKYWQLWVTRFEWGYHRYGFYFYITGLF